MNKFACITGADRGIGFELVRQLLFKGYTVIAGYYLKEVGQLVEIKEEFQNQLHLVSLDISNDLSVKHLYDYITGVTDTLDILINNAGILGDIETNIFDVLDFDEMGKVFNVNTLGALRMTNTLIPLIMKSSTKLIVNISSEASSIKDCNRKSWFSYCMSKSALNMQSSIIHNTIKEQGGQVLIIHPGWVQTYMQGKLDEKAELTPKISAEHISKIVTEHEKYKGDKPAFVDYLGRGMEW